jgi:hypothetical protein
MIFSQDKKNEETSVKTTPITPRLMKGAAFHRWRDIGDFSSMQPEKWNGL